MNSPPWYPFAVRKPLFQVGACARHLRWLALPIGAAAWWIAVPLVALAIVLSAESEIER